MGVRLLIAVPLLLLKGICQILETEKDIKIVARASTQEEIISFVEQKEAEVLFLDTAISHSDIVTFLELIRDKSPEMRILLLPHGWNEEMLIDALFLGIRGYVTATLNAEQFIKAIKVVSKDGMWVERRILTKAFARLVPPRKDKPRLLKLNLTKGEQKIVKLILQGYSTKQISRTLDIRKQTVKNYLGSIFKKCSVSNRLSLVIKFLGEGISQSNSSTNS